MYIYEDHIYIYIYNIFSLHIMRSFFVTVMQNLKIQVYP